MDMMLEGQRTLMMSHADDNIPSDHDYYAYFFCMESV